MNKIPVENEYLFLKDGEFELNSSKKLILNIDGMVTIKEKSNKVGSYIINLKPNSHLKYYKYNNLNKVEKIIINSDNNTTIDYYYSFVCKKVKKIDLVHNIKGNDNESNIVIKGVTEDAGVVDITVNAKVKKHTQGNVISENVKILKLNDQESIIKPNLEVDTNEVVASHTTTCKGIGKDELFYLTSKGMSEASSIELIKNGFLNKNIEILQINE